ncbi:hypothetical protein [Texcoconibacillus texcoconensis]|uniref:Uncharacterized protein n=1 Tax=Texcoconibacillus texcoconensis TaxID=1095777 RepID=A0A840QQK3_9BACI|nr:hypothetical protein [Texcoconibacillus texcoconensis]MBB5173611.1 hypothetical protein [Texcoconibacillus texcoconensis]
MKNVALFIIVTLACITVWSLVFWQWFVSSSSDRLWGNEAIMIEHRDDRHKPVAELEDKFVAVKAESESDIVAEDSKNEGLSISPDSDEEFDFFDTNEPGLGIGEEGVPLQQIFSDLNG